jgi:hypothetical protein
MATELIGGGELVRRTDISAVVVDVVASVTIVVAEEDADAIADGFIDYLNEFEFDDLPHLDLSGGFKPDSAATQVSAHREITDWIAIDQQDTYRKAGVDAILPPAVGSDEKPNCREAGFSRVGHGCTNYRQPRGTL